MKSEIQIIKELLMSAIVRLDKLEHALLHEPTSVKVGDKKQTYYLDVRRPKKNGKFPVKVRVWSSTAKRAKFIRTGLDMTEIEFNKALTNGELSDVIETQQSDLF